MPMRLSASQNDVDESNLMSLYGYLNTEQNTYRKYIVSYKRPRHEQTWYNLNKKTQRPYFWQNNKRKTNITDSNQRKSLNYSHHNRDKHTSDVPGWIWMWAL